MIWLAALGAVFSLAPLAAGGPPPVAGGGISRLAPAFTLADVKGRRHSLAEYRGHPVALFFFCGCEPCHRTGRAWGQIQRAALSPPRRSVATSGPDGRADPGARTLVVFLGDAPAARDFAAAVGLDRSRTVLLIDPDSRGALAYDALPCPRVFVLDAEGAVRYTNTHADDSPPAAPAAVIASRALEALSRHRK